MKVIERPPVQSKNEGTKLTSDSDAEERLRLYVKWKKVTAHPNLRVDYFQEINTKDKAYWLGFIYADGSITRHKGTTQIRVHLSRDNEPVIDRFCECLGLEKSRKGYRTDTYGNESVEIGFLCKIMGSDLQRHGLKFRKSKINEYPQLPTEECELAFLLGYYDGDGTQKTTIISSGNTKFLEQIKRRFGLPFKIQVRESDTEFCGRRIRGTVYWMCLGAELFLEMMRNYKLSMREKRWFPCTKEEAAQRAREALTSKKKRERKKQQTQWREITPAELQKLIWEIPSIQIAEEYNVHHSTVAAKCDRLGIPRPRRGYWQIIRAMQKGAKQNQ